MDCSRKALRAAKCITPKRLYAVFGYIRRLEQMLQMQLFIPITHTVLLYTYFDEALMVMKSKYYKSIEEQIPVQQYHWLSEIGELLQSHSFNKDTINTCFNAPFIKLILNKLNHNRYNHNENYIKITSDVLKVLQQHNLDKSIISQHRPHYTLYYILLQYVDSPTIVNSVLYLLSRMISYDRYTKWFLLRLHQNCHQHRIVNFHQHARNMIIRIDTGHHGIQTLQYICCILQELAKYSVTFRDECYHETLNIILEILKILKKFNGNKSECNKIVSYLVSLISTITEQGKNHVLCYRFLKYLQQMKMLNYLMQLLIFDVIELETRNCSNQIIHNIICSNRYENIDILLATGYIDASIDKLSLAKEEILRIDEMKLNYNGDSCSEQKADIVYAESVSLEENSQRLTQFCLLLQSPKLYHNEAITNNPKILMVINQQIQNEQITIVELALQCVEQLIKKNYDLKRFDKDGLIDTICKLMINMDQLQENRDKAYHIIKQLLL